MADCKTGSPEETLFAVVVSSIGQRIKIISAVREVSAVSNLGTVAKGSKLFTCSICQSNFSQFEAYWDHLKRFHELSRDGWIKINCPLCSMLFTNTKTLWNHVKYVCLKKGAVDRPCPHIPENIQNITEMEVEDVVEVGPSLVAEINVDYKLAFIKSLQMSGSISLVKSGEILASANSLVNTVVEIAKGFANSKISKDDLIIKLNTLKDPFHKSNSSQYQIEKSLKDHKLLNEPREIKLGSHFKFDKTAGLMKEKFDFMYYFKISQSLPIILMQYKTACNFVLYNNNPNLFSNFKSGEFYKKNEWKPTVFTNLL